MMRFNRAPLQPSLVILDHENGFRNDFLQGRLEELLVFEIKKEGGTAYKRFNVRTLYRYVMKAIRHESTKNARNGRTRTDSLALERSIRNQTPVEGSPIVDVSKSEQLPTTEPVFPSVSESPRNQEHAGAVTWRERLGGFLHPRDMRKLVTPFSASNEPELIVRRHAMLLNFDPLRAIILRDRAMVLVPDGADSLLVQLEKRIRGEPHSAFHESQGGIIRTNSSLALDKLDATGRVDSSYEDGNETVGSDDDSFRDSLIGGEWADLDAKDWIDLPFELQSVDAVLSSVSSMLTDEVVDLQHGANRIIADLIRPDADVGDLGQETLRTLKNLVRERTSRVMGFNRALDTVLEDYEDMALMNLSRLLTHPERFVQPVPQAVLEEESDEPELILEAHLQRGHTLVNALSLVEGQITSTEDFAIRRSDTIRNRLLYINMVISVLSLAVASGSMVGAIYGMNVINDQEGDHNAFRKIVWSTLCGIVTFAVAILVGLRRVGALPNILSKQGT